MCWTAELLRDVRNGDVMHVVPVDDAIEHDWGPDGDQCVCVPEIDPVDFQDAASGEISRGWLIVHSSLDGREHHEADHDEDACPLCRHGLV